MTFVEGDCVFDVASVADPADRGSTDGLGAAGERMLDSPSGLNGRSNFVSRISMGSPSRGGFEAMSDTRSPIDPALLRPVLAPTLGASRTLPALAYLSEDVLGWESEHFFRDGWVCVGRADDLENPVTSVRSG